MPATPAASGITASFVRRATATPPATAAIAVSRSSTSIAAIACQALCEDPTSAPATVTSRLYQGRNSDSASTSPPRTATPP
jgi:hypothetical protein